MGLFGRMLGIEDDTDRRAVARPPSRVGAPVSDPQMQALERYRYMLRTAPPETLEQAHAEAFAKLSPQQRRQVLAELAQNAPSAERAAIAATPLDDPRALGRVATRAEIREPGVLERSLGTGAMGFGASLLSSFAMGFVGSMVAQAFFSSFGGFGPEASAETTADGSEAEAQKSPEESSEDDPNADDGSDFGSDFEV
ncbi:MAG TPA: hypothetical protein VJN18_07450 [Polyangiaceae bacterium]|nr:hypothetical protein [Polyangiaceae bacterium]